MNNIENLTLYLKGEVIERSLLNDLVCLNDSLNYTSFETVDIIDRCRQKINKSDITYKNDLLLELNLLSEQVDSYLIEILESNSKVAA